MFDMHIKHQLVKNLKLFIKRKNVTDPKESL